MGDEKKNLGASSSDSTSALFVTARKKQIAEQEAQRKAAEEEAKRVAAEAEVRRLEAEVEERKRKAEEEKKRLEQEEKEKVEAEKKQQQNVVSKVVEKIPVSSKEKKENPLEAVAAKMGMGGEKFPMFLGVCAASIVALFAIIIVCIVVIPKLGKSGKADQSYSDWASLMTLSVDNYNALEEKEKKVVIDTYNDILEDGGETDAQLTFDEANDALSSNSDEEMLTAFHNFCMVKGADFVSFVNGDGSMANDAVALYLMNGNTFLNLSYPEMVAVVIEDQKWFEQKYGIETEYGYLVAGEIADLLAEYSEEELNQEGLIFQLVAADCGGDPVEEYNMLLEVLETL